MTTQPPKASRLKRIVYTVLGIILILALLIGLRIYNRVQANTVLQPKVIAAMHANFPNFCKDGQISAEPDPYPYIDGLLIDHAPKWGIKCDTWLKQGLYYGEATYIDVDHCTTVHPLAGTTGPYYNEYQAINKTNGQKLAVCP